MDELMILKKNKIFSSTFLLFLVGFCFQSSWVHSSQQKIEAAKASLIRLEAQLRLHEQNFQKYSHSETTPFEQRVADGRLNFILKDYAKASINLFDAVENPKNKNHSKWPEAVFLLGESLFQERNYSGSYKYYKLLLDGNFANYRSRALLRVLEGVLKTTTFHKATPVMGSIALVNSAMKNKLLYLQGKILYKQKLYSKALEAFSAVSSSSEDWGRSRYFMGVVSLVSQAYSESVVQSTVKLYQETLSQLPQEGKGNNLQQKVRDVLILGVARLFVQQGKEEEALKEYDKIQQNSHVFDEALFEICGVYLKKSEKQKTIQERRRFNEKALKSLELLLSYLPDSELFSQAQLLKGHLLLQQNQFMQAMENYQVLVKKYSGVYDEMNHFAGNDGLEKFKEILSKKKGKVDLSQYLPKDAVAWMKTEDSMERVFLLLKDIKMMHDHLRDGQRIIQKLEGAIQLEDSIALSPTLKEGRSHVVSIRRELISLQADLNKVEQSQIISRMTSDEKAKYRELKDRLSALRSLFQQGHQSFKDVSDQNRVVYQKIDAMLLRIHKVALKLQYSQKVLKAVRDWLLNSSEARKLTPEKRNSLREDANQLERTNDTLSAEKERLLNEIDLAKIQLEYGSLGKKEMQLQKEYQDKLAEESKLLQQFRSKLGADEQQLVDSISSLQKRIQVAQLQTSQVLALLKEKGKVNNSFVKTELFSEKKKMMGYQEQITKLQGKSTGLISQIAYQGFLSVRYEFYKTVLKADVGVIDVAWQQKRSIQKKLKSKKINQAKQLGKLRSEFRELLEEIQ